MTNEISGGEIRYTERSNEITTDIDIAEVNEIVDLLNRADGELFKDFYDGQPGLMNQLFIDRINDLAREIAEIMNAANGGNVKIVFSGCGTSGRLGFASFRKFNEICKTMKKPEIFDYLIASGDKALFKSFEAEEDDSLLGRKCLEKVISNTEKSIFIGISCGLSAAYVAGQLNFATEKIPKCRPVIIGFNPIQMAKSHQIVNWDKSFKDVALRMEETKSFLINPVIGPEPITGSSRMKGGTATKIILDTLFIAAMAISHANETVDCKEIIKAYERSIEYTQGIKGNIAECISNASDSLASGGHVYYLGFNASGFYGILDASECIPTYGANYNDIRGFIKGGYATLGNKEGDLSNVHDNFCLSIDYFNENILQQLSDNDYVIAFGDKNNAKDLQVMKRNLDQRKCKVTLLLLGNCEQVVSKDDDGNSFSCDSACSGVAVELIRETSAKKMRRDMGSSDGTGESNMDTKQSQSDNKPLHGSIDENANDDSRVAADDQIWSQLQNNTAGVVMIDLSPTKNIFKDQEFEKQLKLNLAEITLKRVLNMISTGAYVLNGKVWKNFMIDLKVSNDKLFRRAVSIIQKFSNIEESEAKDYLMRAIYETDEVSEEMRNAEVGEIIEKATKMDKIVPISLLLSSRKLTFANAKGLLNSERTVRKCLMT